MKIVRYLGHYQYMNVCSYSVDVNMDKQLVNKDSFRDPVLRKKAKREVKAKFEERLVFFVELLSS